MSPAIGRAVQGQILTNKAGVRFTPPPPTDSATASKIRLLRELGVNLAPSALGTSIWLTPQRPYMDANTHLGANGDFFTSYDVTAGMPYGHITIPGAPRESGYFTMINFRADPTRYYFVQCIVSDRPEYGYRPDATVQTLAWSAARDGRVNFVIAPSLQPTRRALLWGIGRALRRRPAGQVRRGDSRLGARSRQGGSPRP